MAKCRICGGPLTRGNIKVVRKPGKRTVRVHRRCPQARSEVVQIGGNIESTGTALQRPQVSTTAPIVVEGVLEHLDPPKYRYFVTRATAEKVQRAIKGAQVGITVEVIPVPDYQVEADPEALADYIEVEFEMKGGKANGPVY